MDKKKLRIGYWYVGKIKGLEYEHGEERDYSELHAIIDIVLASGNNVMISQIKNPDDDVFAVVYISDGMFKQR